MSSMTNRGNGASLFIRALSRGLPQKSLPQRQPWRSIVYAMEGVRGKQFYWISRTRMDREPIEHAGRVIEKCPALKAWVGSDSCMVSPRTWPIDVTHAFEHGMIPTPYEFANLKIPSGIILSLPERKKTGIYYLALYSLGMSIEYLSWFFDGSEDMAAQQLCFGARALSALPRFKVWASATDFSKANLPSHLKFKSIRNKLEYFRTLDENPLWANKAITASLVESRSYLTYLIYKSPKKHRLSLECYFPRTKEVRNVSS